ncbi:aldo/keto reductase [Arenibacter sp. GZD96]|uniref:aldo/keto reductase n=1 Tax=Aurantibrevibacter litoralis TaxID=3106030 RepID=UPI002AFEDC6F|nr:aldo/keto reductase [Arenibacter sp. GZD-96]MEA1785590.1 aldo/keto reductase [Arenibacter sp. GZD-96]
MKKIRGNGGLELSNIVHGHWRLAEWNLSDRELLRLTQQIIDLGITTFDHADIYGNYSCETLFGNALALKKELRNQIQIVTKCGIKLISDKYPARKVKHYDYSYEHTTASVENSLRHLRTDRIDLLLLHRPSPFFNPEEVARAFSELHRSGKVLHFGVSNFSIAQFVMLAKHIDMPLVTNQVEISPFCLEHFENGNMEFFLKENINPMAWSPLAGGEIVAPKSEKGHRVHQILAEVAHELHVDGIDKIAYAWLLKHPAGILPIVGSQKLERTQAAAEALTIDMSLEQWFKIYIAAKGEELP